MSQRFLKHGVDQTTRDAEAANRVATLFRTHRADGALQRHNAGEGNFQSRQHQRILGYGLFWALRLGKATLAEECGRVHCQTHPIKTVFSAGAGMKILQTAPLQFVPNIATQLRFWTSLKYNTTISVPDKTTSSNEPIFVALQLGDKEIMLQTIESANSDLQSVMPFVGSPGTALYHTVDSLQGYNANSEGADVLLGPRKTWYGAIELWIKDPAGHVHAFAEKKS